MDTTFPTEATSVRLLVKARLVQASGAIVSLPSVQCSIYDVTDGSVIAGSGLLTTGTTNDSGLVDITFSIPGSGRNLMVIGNYGGQIERAPSILICRNGEVTLTFTESRPPVDCSALNLSDTIMFADESGATTLGRNSGGAGHRYTQCWSLTNGGPGDMTARLGSLVAPFMVEQVYVDGRVEASQTGPFIIPAGKTLSVCVSAGTEAAGTFQSRLDIDLSCGAATETARLDCKASVAAATCACPAGWGAPTAFSTPRRLKVGESDTLDRTMLVNALSCPVTVTGASVILGSAEWSVLTLVPQTISPGVAFVLRVRYAPIHSGISNASVVLALRLEGGTQCSLTLGFDGTACRDACPSIEVAGVDYQVPVAGLADDLTGSRGIMASLRSENPPVVSTATGRYMLRLPADACDAIDMTVGVAPAPGHDPDDVRYFSVTPSTIHLVPGGSVQVTVTFTASDIAVFRALAAGVPTRIFRAALRVAGGACDQRVAVSATVNDCPGATRVIVLHAYNQYLDTRIPPDNEIYTFGDTAIVRQKGPGGVPGPVIPTIGDLYVRIANAVGIPPNPPTLVLRLGLHFDGMVRVVPPFTEMDLADCIAARNLLCSRIPSSPDSTELNGLVAGEVVAFRSAGGSVYGLIFIKNVEDGTIPAQWPYSQSAIDFRVLYPVYCN